MGPWLSPEDLESVRRKVPMVYVTAVPVRLDTDGTVDRIGVMLRASDDGTLQREVVSGRVLALESLRAALMRHLERDLGALCFPQLAPNTQPFTVAEFFPTPGVSPYFDARQHAIALCYVVPIAGDCKPQDETLDVEWVDPHGPQITEFIEQMNDGHGTIVRQALAWVNL